MEDKRHKMAQFGLLVCATLLVAPIVAAARADEQQESQAQARVGGLEPSDYVDEAGELEVMASQQQIPTAQIMSAAGHLVPENFFLPGGSIPALYSRYQQQASQQQHQSHHHHQQQQQQQQSQLHQHQLQIQEAQQALRDAVQARQMSPVAAAKFARQIDLMNAASEQHGPDVAQLIEYNTYRDLEPAGQRDPSARDLSPAASMELAEFLAGPQAPIYEQQQQHQQQQHYDQDLAAMVLAGHHQQLGAAEHMAQAASEPNELQYANQVGPAYQISEAGGYGQQQQQQYGLPTKSSSKEPSGMLKPLGNPKTVSSPIIDFATQHLPKTSQFEKLAEKLPHHQTPTVFSFSSAKDPLEKGKGVRQKKTTMIKQAEQLARSMIKAVNEKFGTQLGDQSDLPFLLSSIGPLGIAQNLLFDPTLLVTLLNSAEKTYFADVLPAPAKMAMGPLLNIFRVPNKKRDKANLLNILSYLASGGQTSAGPAASSGAVRHRQALGVEKQSVAGKSSQRAGQLDNKSKR